MVGGPAGITLRNTIRPGGLDESAVRPGSEWGAGLGLPRSCPHAQRSRIVRPLREVWQGRPCIPTDCPLCEPRWARAPRGGGSGERGPRGGASPVDPFRKVEE
uniref:Uncharacterized protein n=1 Tax=Sus scrofa TaxID=9823 RepID=A0A8D0MP17_PIG